MSLVFVCTHKYPYVTRMNSRRVLVTVVRDSSIKTVVENRIYVARHGRVTICGYLRLLYHPFFVGPSI